MTRSSVVNSTSPLISRLLLAFTTSNRRGAIPRLPDVKDLCAVRNSTFLALQRDLRQSLFAPGHDEPAVLHLGAFGRFGALWTRRIGPLVRVSDSHSAFTLVNFSPAAGGFERVRGPNTSLGV
jgi:hypothetical protein